MGSLGWFYNDRAVNCFSLKECRFDVDCIEVPFIWCYKGDCYTYIFLEKVRDSVLKLSASSNALAHGLAFVKYFPYTSFCLMTQSTDIVGWPLFSISSNLFSDLQLWSFFSLAFKILWLNWVIYIWFNKISSVELVSYPFPLICRSLNGLVDTWIWKLFYFIIIIWLNFFPLFNIVLKVYTKSMVI